MARCPLATEPAMPIDLSRRQCLALAGALATLPNAALTRPAWAGQSRPASSRAPVIQLPALGLRERRLANGLQVVSAVDRSSSTVSVQVWYRVGGKDDPVGRSGFAHLFEHLMFKGTRHMPDEMFDRLTEDVGGQNNAFTSEDVTAYQNEVPANHLQRLLWAEAERLAHLNVDQANFDSERQVVIEEFRERVLSDPYGRLFNALPGLIFDVHPYRRPVVGNIDELQAATLDDVRQFQRLFYRPDNAVLIVVGDFDPAQLDASIDRYFGPLARPDSAVPRGVTLREPALAANRRAQVHGPKVPLPAVALLWRGPAASHPDAPALKVAAALLAAGDSSRLNEALVYRTQAAQAVGFAADLFADAGMLAAYAIAASGRPLPALAAALVEQIRRLAQGPLPAAEMDKVRARMLGAAVLARQTAQGKAEAIGLAVLLHGDARQADSELARLQAVSAADVQRVLKTHLLDAHRVTVHYTQQAA